MKNKKSLGQHWLNNRLILNEIADLARADNTADFCIEIGPGLGTLTASLLKRFARVQAIEYDAELARKLPGSFPGTALEVINADILECDFSEIREPYVVAGNIPYYITSPIVEKMLSVRPAPARVVLLMQKEVAERMAAVDGSSRISLFVENRAKAWLGPVVNRDEFTPPPKVDSQVLVLEPYLDGPKYPEGVMGLIGQAFAAPRKKLAHNLAGIKPKAEMMEILTGLGLGADVRPADLTLDDYFKLYQALQK